MGLNDEKQRVSSELQNVIGADELTRPEVLQKLWAYIKDNNLQDEEDGRLIHCDDALKKVFGEDTVSMFKMNGTLNAHLEKI